MGLTKVWSLAIEGKACQRKAGGMPSKKRSPLYKCNQCLLTTPHALSNPLMHLNTLKSSYLCRHLPNLKPNTSGISPFFSRLVDLTFTSNSKTAHHNFLIEKKEDRSKCRLCDYHMILFTTVVDWYWFGCMYGLLSLIFFLAWCCTSIWSRNDYWLFWLKK